MTSSSLLRTWNTLRLIFAVVCEAIKPMIKVESESSFLDIRIRALFV